jgi:hypothetical protein
VPAAVEAAVKGMAEWEVESVEEAAEVWALADPASAPNVATGLPISLVRPVSTSAVPPVVWRWCVKARLTTRKSKADAPRAMSRAERRAEQCLEETVPDQWERDR